jgi:hypothetical protein
MHICHLAAKRYTDSDGVLWFGSHHPANLLIGFGTPNQRAGNRPYLATNGKVIHPWRKAGKELHTIKVHDVMKFFDEADVRHFLANSPSKRVTKALNMKQSKILAECGVLDIGLQAELERVKTWHSDAEVLALVEQVRTDLQEVEGFYGTYQTEIWAFTQEQRKRVKAGEINRMEAAREVSERGDKLREQGAIEEDAIAWDVIWAKWDLLYDKMRDLALETDIPYDKEHAAAA